MDRLIAPNTVAEAQADVPPSSGTPGFATDGNPASNIPATQWPAYQYNAFQEELIAILAAAGITPDRTNNAQVVAAIQKLAQGMVDTYLGFTSYTTPTTLTRADSGKLISANATTLTLPLAATWAPTSQRGDGFTIFSSASNGNSTTVSVDTTGGTDHIQIGSQVFTSITIPSGQSVRLTRVTSITWVAQGTAIGANIPLVVSPATQSQHAAQLGQVSGVVGSVRNLRCFNAAVGTSLTFTADEVVLESALGGLRYCAANLNASVSTTVTGALGGVVGAALTASGFAGVYIGITSTGTVGFFINTAGTTTLLPNVSASPPGGVIASALISVWPLNASTQFIVALQNDRRVRFTNVNVLSTSSVAGTPTSLSLSPIVPANAKKAKGYFSFQSTVSTSVVGAAIGGANPFLDVISGQGLGQQSFSYEIDMATAQTIFWQASNSAGTFGLNGFVAGYEF